jgi:prophage DNA circulation protein
MTRDGVRILTDNDLREYFLARARYGRLLMKLSEERRIVVEDISKLKAYSKYAERLVESKRSVKKNIAQYNEAARALIEAKMSIMVDPDLMEKMYDDAMEKETARTLHEDEEEMVRLFHNASLELRKAALAVLKAAQQPDEQKDQRSGIDE